MSITTFFISLREERSALESVNSFICLLLSFVSNYCHFRFFYSNIEILMSTSACGEQVHRYFISPPSLWPGRELRAYHCPSCASWRNAGATRILLLMVPAADQADSRLAKPECTGSGLFNFQKTCKHGGRFTQVKRKVTVAIQDICIATVIRALENVPGV